MKIIDSKLLHPEILYVNLKYKISSYTRALAWIFVGCFGEMKPHRDNKTLPDYFLWISENAIMKILEVFPAYIIPNFSLISVLLIY